jgi:CubicO group peptidase (beta-lactamase class C family)
MPWLGQLRAVARTTWLTLDARRARLFKAGARRLAACRHGAATVGTATLALLAACATPPPPPENVARGDQDAVRRHVEALIASDMRAHQVTGLSIALVDDQRVVWAFGSGWADQAARRPADANTVYRMGSISKLFTGVAALQLAEAGRLGLDAPIQQALPGFRIASRHGAAPITPRQLMTHHAGLPRDIAYRMWGAATQPLQQRVADVARESAPSPPGLHLAYSNVGVTVLGAAVEAVAGQPFDTLMQQRLFTPLGMRTASFSAAVPAQPEMSLAYRDGQATGEPALNDVPAGGLNASVLDLAQFMKMVFADGRSPDASAPVLSPATVREMLRPQNAGVPLDLGFKVGLGWMLSTLGGEPIEGAGPVAHHGGATVNFRSQMILLPEHKLGVVVAANSAGATPVVNRVAQRALALALQAKTGIRQADPGADASPDASWAPEQLQALVGDYTTSAGFVHVARDGDALFTRIGGRRMDLVPCRNGELRLRHRLFGLWSVPLGELSRVRLALRTVAGRQLLVARIGSQTLRVGERLPPAQPLPQALQALAGTYLPELAPGEFGTVERVVVTHDAGRLLAQLQLRGEPLAPARQVLQPLNDTEALVLETLADVGEVVRVERGGPDPVIRAAGYRWHRVADARPKAE